MKATAKNARRHDGGFTLVELLVVMAILGLIAASAAPDVMKHLGGAKSNAARIQVQNLATTLDLYRLETGRYPNDREGLVVLVERPPGDQSWDGPYLKRKDSLIDPWGRPYAYRFPGRHGAFDLFSLGADNREGGDGEDKDLTSW